MFGCFRAGRENEISVVRMQRSAEVDAREDGEHERLEERDADLRKERPALAEVEVPLEAEDRVHAEPAVGVVIEAQDLAACPPRKSLRPPFKPCQIVGNERIKLMIPPAATAPAPM